MGMDLIGLSNGIKNLSDEQLQLLQKTSPEVPPFLVMAELQRRDQMRKEYQEQAQRSPSSQKTVAQELTEKLRQPMQGMPQGMPGGQPPQQRMGIAAIPGAAPGAAPGMAAGGMVGYADGGEMDDGDDSQLATDEAMPAPQQIDPRAPMPLTVDQYNKAYPGFDMAEAVRQAKQVAGPDHMAAIAAILEQQKQPKINPWQALAQAGFAMAAEPTHSFGRAIGIAGLNGIQNLQQQRDTNRVATERNLQDRMTVAAQQSNDANRIASIADQIYQHGNARANELAQVLSANQRLAMGNPSYQYAVAEMTANPSLSYDQAFVLGQKKLLQSQLDYSQKVKAAQLNADAKVAAHNAAPENQMFNGVVAQIAKKYNVQVPPEYLSFSDLPLPAQDEAWGIIRRRNPTIATMAMAKAGGDPAKAWDWMMQYHTANQKKTPDPAALTRGSGDFDPSKFGGVPVQ